MRIALTTQAAPFELQPRAGLYNLRLAQAIRDLGHQCEVFVCSMKMPPVLGIGPMRERVRRFNARPDRYEYQRIVFNTVRGYLPHPMWLRSKVSPRWPGLASWLIGRPFTRGLREKLRAYNPDFMLFTDGVCLGPIGARLSRELAVPWASVDHDPFLFPHESPLGRTYAKTLASTTFAAFVADKYARHARDVLGITQAITIYNGTQFPTESQRTTPRPGDWSGRVILTVGTFIPRKAHEYLIRGFAKSGVADATLVIVGKPAPAPLISLCKDLGVEGRVRFIDFQPQEQIAQLMCWADLFALPSWDESFGLVYVEALAAETPVILCDDCGLAGTIKHGEHGWVLPVRDVDAVAGAIREAFTTADLARMGKAGRALVEANFTWQNVAKRVLDAINERVPALAQKG